MGSNPARDAKKAYKLYVYGLFYCPFRANIHPTIATRKRYISTNHETTIVQLLDYQKLRSPHFTTFFFALNHIITIPISKVYLSKRPQTRALIDAYHQFGQQGIIRIIDEVNIMTPESIHFNSFMYEPLLDMDVSELFNLYRRVQALQT